MLGNQNKSPGMQAVCFLRPTKDNITRLRRELRDPHFAEYHLCTPLFA